MKPLLYLFLLSTCELLGTAPSLKAASIVSNHVGIFDVPNPNPKDPRVPLAFDAPNPKDLRVPLAF
jgi:hypothetical protein